MNEYNLNIYLFYCYDALDRFANLLLNLKKELYDKNNIYENRSTVVEKDYRDNVKHGDANHNYDVYLCCLTAGFTCDKSRWDYLYELQRKNKLIKYLLLDNNQDIRVTFINYKVPLEDVFTVEQLDQLQYWFNSRKSTYNFNYSKNDPFQIYIF